MVDTTTSAMDPWGGSVREAGEEANYEASALGFDDDFTDALNCVVEDQSLPSAGGSVTPIACHKPSTVNFIPRIQNRDEELTMGSAMNASPFPCLAPLKDPLTQMMTSEEYISRLEARLRRIKGGGGRGRGGGDVRCGRKVLSSSAKQMIDAFALAKESTAGHVVDSCGPYSDSSRMEINPNLLLQKAFPERIPLTQEELELLVNHDQLQLPEDHEDQQPYP